MPLAPDPEYVKCIEWLLPKLQSYVPPPVGDWETRRNDSNASVTALFERWPEATNVEHDIINITAEDGREIPVHYFRKTKSDAETLPGPAALYTHGGGFFLLNVDHYRKLVAHYCSRSGIPFFMVDYRFAPEHRFPASLDDCYSALTWLSHNASKFNVDPKRIAVVGDSAGGNLAAALAVKARDEKFAPPLAQQMIIAGMLDDRKVSSTFPEEVLATATWSVEDNITGWNEYIGKDNVGGGSVSPYAAPARVESLEGLPPTYIDVSQMDIFCEENIAFATRLMEANVETELHVWKGVPHSFEFFAYDLKTTQNAIQVRADFLRSL